MTTGRPPRPDPSPRSAFAVLALLNLVWGGSLPATKVALDSFGPLTLAAARLTLAAVLFLLVVDVRSLFRLGWRATAGMAVLGVIGFSGTQVLQAVGTTGTDAATATVLASTAPLWIAGFAAVLLREHLGALPAIGLVVALVGVVLVSGLAASWPPKGTVADGLVVLASGLTVGIYTVLGKKQAQEYPPLLFTGVGCIGGAIVTIPFGAWQAASQPRVPTAAGWAMVAYLGLIVTFAGFIIWFWGLRVVAAGRAGALMFLQPVSGLAISALVLGNRLTPAFLLGTALVLAGTVLAARA